MKTVQMTIDAGLLDEVDAAAEATGTTRSAFIRRALKGALRQMRISEMERLHAEGYSREPSVADEAAEWDGARDWGDD